MGTILHMSEKPSFRVAKDSASSGDMLLVSRHGLLRNRSECEFVTAYDGSFWVHEGDKLLCLNDRGDFQLGYEDVPCAPGDMPVIVGPTGGAYMHDWDTGEFWKLREKGVHECIAQFRTEQWAPMSDALIWYIGCDDNGQEGLCLFNGVQRTRTRVEPDADFIVGVTPERVYVASEADSSVFALSRSGIRVYECPYPRGVRFANAFVTPSNEALFVRDDLNGVTVHNGEGRELARVHGFMTHDFVGVSHHGLWFEHDNMLGCLVV